MNARGRRPGRAEQAAVDEPPSPKALAVRMLARRDYSRAELAQRLRRKGVAEDAIEPALDALAAAGYLSDARFAQALVSQRKGRYGMRAIVHALKERGIAAPDAAGALAQLAGGDELGEARALWRRRFGAVPRDEREKARQVRFLLARGYALSVALAVMRGVGVDASDE